MPAVAILSRRPSARRDERFFQGDGYAVAEDPFGRSPGWIKFAEASRYMALQLIHRLSRKATAHLSPYFLPVS